MDLPPDLRTGLDAAVAGVPPRELALAVERLIAVYRAGGPAEAPILTGGRDVAAYATYRMPATYAAVRSALAQLAVAAPDLAPRDHLDLGGGTGAAAWAAAHAFASITHTTVLDQVAATLDLGRRIAAGAAAPAVRSAAWRSGGLIGADLPPADLVTISYVLGELAPADRADLVVRAAAAGATVIVIEPGTPAGYQRVLEARERLIEAGLSVLAPCPHQGPCPIVPGRDWCHFVARVNRSGLHRQVKRAELSYEDEKFSYVAAGRSPATGRGGRVLRHPRYGKGQVQLRVCTADDGIEAQTVSRRQGEAYRRARDLQWGDAWPLP